MQQRGCLPTSVLYLCNDLLNTNMFDGELLTVHSISSTMKGSKVAGFLAAVTLFYTHHLPFSSVDLARAAVMLQWLGDDRFFTLMPSSFYLFVFLRQVFQGGMFVLSLPVSASLASLVGSSSNR